VLSKASSPSTKQVDGGDNESSPNDATSPKSISSTHNDTPNTQYHPEDGKSVAYDVAAHKTRSEQLQMNLMEVWDKLELPMIERLKFVTKYSQDKTSVNLYNALDAWKKAAELVALRERILAVCRKLLKEHISMIHLFSKEDEAFLQSIDCFVSSNAMFGQVSA
jgi:hypothetical protein